MDEIPDFPEWTTKNKSESSLIACEAKDKKKATKGQPSFFVFPSHLWRYANYLATKQVARWDAGGFLSAIHHHNYIENTKLPF